MDDIKDIVKKVFTGISTKTIAEQKKISVAVEKIFESNKINGVKIGGYKDKHLFVSVGSSTQLYQANLIKGKILKQLQAEVPEIEKISFKISNTN